jgi:ATP-dependent RNA helicase SUPV3L1/SUV3
VVLGALSPRTRNAQVEIYQSGDVDYLVATDAIGMGLNLDVDHIAFASDRKFDGYQFRKLNPSELAQIAGRAGRHTRDGTFGTTGRCDPFDAELVERLENHNFEPVRMMQWRNNRLDFDSIKSLLESLSTSPHEEGLTRAPVADDVLVLERSVQEKDISALATTPADVERLWDACQLPDYRKIAPAAHAELVMTLYGFLMREGRVPADWIARQAAHADRTDGDIDTLSNRIAQVRTWTFAANRPDWLNDPEHWQGVTRAIEDRLSDALHERLTQRFVDRRTSVLLRRLRENAALETEITSIGDVVVEGHVIGRLSGFEFAAVDSSGEPEAKALRGAAQKVLASEIEVRAAKLAESKDEAFILGSDGTIRWTGDPVAKLIAADNVLEPRFRILADEQLTGPARDIVETRIALWLKSHIEKLLGPLIALGKTEDVTGIARGVAFQLVEALGVLERHKVAEEVKSLEQPARATLRQHGVRFGAYHVYLPILLKPAPRALSLLLFALKHGGLMQKGISDLPLLTSSGRTSIPVDPEVAKPLYRVVGYRVCGPRALRVDILERLADLIRPTLSWRPDAPGEKPAGAVDGHGFTVTVGMTSLAGCAGENFTAILRALGYRMDRRAALTTKLTPASTNGAITPLEVAECAETPVAVEIAPAIAADPVTVADEAATEITSTAAAPSAAEPEMIEVWRPGRPQGDRKSSRRERHTRRPQQKEVQGSPTETTVADASATPAEHLQRHENRQLHQKFQKRARNQYERRADRGSQPDRKQQRRDYPRGKLHHERERPIDPNSPFAALLELKAKLEAEQKNEG